ncbi:MAG: hypothetical protein Q8861_04105 [Bacteroidota bacterium]|nr:hypothetical protein [Bacteroidota bacterium]
MRLLRFTTIRIIILLIAICAGKQVFAATGSVVTVNLNVLPPYSPFYRDYAGYTNNKTVITLLYQSFTSGTPIQVFLSGSIRKDDNKISVQLKDTYRPSIPITLTPNLPKTLTGAQLRNIFGNGSSNDLIMNGITAREIMMNQALPEGNYNVCVQVKDYTTGQALSEACQNIYIAYYEPPQMFWPQNNSTVMATEPQNIITSWSPVTPAIPGLNYRLRVAKLLPGVTPSDALSRSTQVVYEKSDIKVPTFPLDLSSGLRLDTGSMYVMQVVAYSPGAYFKNNGQSDPVMFYYKGNKLQTPTQPIPDSNESQLAFTSPAKANDTLRVNNEKTLLINWCWLKQIQDKQILIKKTGQQSAQPSYHYEPDDSLSVIKHDIARYEVKIYPKGRSKSDGQFKFNRSLVKNAKDSIENHIELGQAAVDSIGFADGNTYNVSLRSYNSSNVEVTPEINGTFVFRKIKDEIPVYNIPVQASLKYSYQGYGQIYPAGNTDVTVEAIVKRDKITRDMISTTGAIDNIFAENTAMKQSSASGKNIPSTLSGKETSLSGKKICTYPYTTIASGTATTDEQGDVKLNLAVPKSYFAIDTIYYKIKVSNKYFVDKNFKVMAIASSRKDSDVVNFGQQVAQTYAFSLKLNVTKAYSSYKMSEKDGALNVKLGDTKMTGIGGYVYNANNDEMEYSVAKRTLADSIPVVLFRVNKPDYIPAIEGDIVSSSAKKKEIENTLYKKKYTIVATGITKRENDSTYVTFDRLLSSAYDGDEYFILAMNGKNDLHDEYSQPLMQQEVQKEFSAVKVVDSKQSKPKAIDALNKNAVSGPVPDSPLTDSGQSPAMEKMAFRMAHKSSNDMIFDDGFVAQEQMFKLSPPNEDDPNAFYRNVKAKYEIISSKPPTSLIKGQLYYTWASDKQSQKRPLANSKFKIVVDYLANGKSVGSTVTGKSLGAGGTAKKEQYFVPNGKETYSDGIKMLDQYATMAVGETDGQGNFQIEVVNINQKGNLGSGTLVEKGWKKYTGNEPTTKPGTDNPGDVVSQAKGKITNPATNMGFAGVAGLAEGAAQTKNMQSLINGGAAQFDVKTGSFLVVGTSTTTFKNGGAASFKTVMHFAPEEHRSGPAPDMYPQAYQFGNLGYSQQTSMSNSNTQGGTPVSTFSRVYRVVPLGDDNQTSPYYYPAKDTFSVQAFEVRQVPISNTCYVKEFNLIVKTADENGGKISDGLAATVFRDINNKPKGLPQGEGDGKYLVKELINPMYTSQNHEANTSQAYSLSNDDKNHLFTTKFEYLQPTTEMPSSGACTFGSLLQQQYLDGIYLLQGCSQANKGAKAYQATIKSADVDDNYPGFDEGDPGYWSGENEIPTKTVTLKLTPMKSRLFFQVKDKSSDLSLSGNANVNAKVILRKQKCISCTEKYPVDQYGYKELFADELAHDGFVSVVGSDKKIEALASASADGYKGISPLSISGDYLGYQFVQQIHLEPKSVLRGKIVSADEKIDGVPKGVAAYLKVDTGKVVWTEDNGRINNIPIAPIVGTKIKIIPKDVAYFDTTFVITQEVLNKMKDGVIDLSQYFVYRRRHRLQFNVKDAKGVALSGVTIQQGDSIVVTNNVGIAQRNFENVSVNNYTFVIKGPSGKGYIPQTINLTSEESPYVKQVSVVMDKGSEISGKVTLDGAPVKHAKVYLEVSESSSPFISHLAFGGSNSLDDDANLVVAYSDAAGNYKLQGIPFDDRQVRVIATLDTAAFTVNGDKKEVAITYKKGSADLSLTSFRKVKINNLFGFPLYVESISELNDHQVKVTGLVDWKYSMSDFKLNEVNKVLRVEDVVYDLRQKVTKPKQTPSTDLNVNMEMVAVPRDSIVPIQGIDELKLSYLDKYNVKLSSGNSGDSGNRGENIFNYTLYRPESLFVEKENNYGKIKGNIHIVDNSFNYPSSYLSFPNSYFYFARKTEDGKLSNSLSVMTSLLSEEEASRTPNFSLLIHKFAPSKPNYYLTDANGDSIRFKLIEFDATANPYKSFIDDQGKIHLNALLKCKIPNAQPENFNVNLDDMIVDENNVHPATKNSPINLSLENWVLKVKNWSFDPKEGGITSNNALIHTSVVDIPVGSFVLRHDMFVFDTQNIGALSIAGGSIKLEEIKGTPHLNFDYKTGRDMHPHWSFGIVQNGNSPVAMLPHLKDLGDDSYRIGLNYIQMLSNDEVIIQLQQQGKPTILKDNTLAKFSPQQILNGPDYVSISGALNVGAPRVGDIPLTVRYTDKNKTMEIDPVNVDFEGKGSVHFSAEKQKLDITSTEITLPGYVHEMPTNTFNPLKSVFSAKPNPNNGIMYSVDVTPGEVTQLTNEGSNSSGGFNLTLSDGKMSAKNQSSDWSTLIFSGDMAQNGQPELQPCKTTFEVQGDISANSNSMSVSSIPTPFGAMTQTFDFAKKRLIGSIRINTPITLGGIATLNSGTIETCFDPEGFYVAGGCNSYIAAGILAGTYNLGFMAGIHPLDDHLWSVTTSYIDPSVVNKCYYKKTNADGLKGFYFAVNRELLNTSISQNFVIVSGYLRAKALVGGDFHANFGKDWQIGGSGYAYLDVAAGLSSVTGTSISGGFGGNAIVAFDIPNFKGSMQMNLGITVKQKLVVTTISKSFDINCKVTAGTQGFGFNLGSGGDAIVIKCE